MLRYVNGGKRQAIGDRNLLVRGPRSAGWHLMCGIAGVLDVRTPDCRPAVERQVRTLDHRGPDAWGVFGGEGAAIGQTRLAIIDLITGDPPIVNTDESVGAVLNGEIYNFASLRAELC